MRSLPSEYALVGDPRALERAGLFVSEGRIVVRRLLESGRFRVHSIAVTPPASAALESALANLPNSPPLYVCAAGDLRTTTGFDFHRGCLALAWRDAPQPSPESLFPARRLLAIEGVSNPDNVGGLFRAAFALDVDAVLLDRSAGDPLYRKAIRTSMAATLRLPFARAADWSAALKALRAQGHAIAALTPHPAATPIDAYRHRVPEHLTIVVGSEGYGLSRESMDSANVQLRIPVDPRADSLNVVVAAAIAMAALR